MIDLSTDYLGLKLSSPLIASSSPLCEDLARVREMEDAGASAVVLSSLFEEQLSLESGALERDLARGAESHGETLSYFPEAASSNLGPAGYLDHLRRCREAVAIPVIASLNGTTPGGWTAYAGRLEQAGASALELNVYDLPTDPAQTGADVEERCVRLVREVRAATRIPLAVKLSPFYSSLPHLARRLSEAGAGALVLFNRFYQPDFDLERLEAAPHLTLSGPDELLLRLRWTAILFGKVPCDLAVTGGVHSGLDVLKAMMAGANAAMTASALLRHGIGRLRIIRSELESWMAQHEYESVRQMRGSMSLERIGDASAVERANYLKVLRSYALRGAERP